MKITFPYESEHSSIFGIIKRPIVNVSFWSHAKNKWLTYTMVVDTGADYTLLPYSASGDLEINLEKETEKFKTFGIGGSEIVYLIKKFKIRVGERELFIPVGFLGRDDIPPLLGREQCLNNFKVFFSNFITTFN